VLRSAASLFGMRDAAPDAATRAADTAREVRLLRLVAHPNVVRVLGTASQERSLVLEWCDTDLAQARSPA
jgi:hypothetical protein